MARRLTDSARPVRGLASGLGLGILAGLLGAVVMGMYAMIAHLTYKGAGFFTPLYHIAATFTDPKSMEVSMREAMAGRDFYFDAGPATLGLAVHMMTGAAWGALFGLLAVGLTRLGAVVAGVVYGAAVLVVMSFVVLPVVADLFGGGPPISDMAEMSGWGTFTVEHLMFGLVTGVVVAAWPRPAAAGSEVTAGRHERQRVGGEPGLTSR